MRRITYVEESREECLERAERYAWSSRDCATPEAAAWFHEQARKWRSLALIAKPKAPSAV